MVSGNTYSKFFATTLTPGLNFPDGDKCSRGVGELAIHRPEYIKLNSKPDSTGFSSNHCLKQDGCLGGDQRLDEEAAKLNTTYISPEIG